MSSSSKYFGQRIERLNKKEREREELTTRISQLRMKAAVE
jgi:hypothetical protein